MSKIDKKSEKIKWGGFKYKRQIRGQIEREVNVGLSDGGGT